MYKVFINHFPVFLARTDETINIKNHFVDINCSSSKQAKEIISKHLTSDGKTTFIARHENLDELFQFFFKDYTPVKAAGGLVLNEKDEMLFIYRNEKWDLPKGKIDPGEDEETAAIREVNEECGLSGHRIEKKLCDTFHTYPINNKLALKTTAWFLMRVENVSSLKPQMEEGITEVGWKKKSDLNEIMKNTYGSIEDVLNHFDS